MSEPSGGEQLHFSLNTQIAVPTPTTEARLAIRRSDWSRIRRNLARCNESPSNLSVWYSICFGMTVSTGASIIPIGATKALPAWVWPLYVCVTGASFFLGTVLVFLDKQLSQQRRSQIADLDTDMDDVERAFESQNVGGITS